MSVHKCLVPEEYKGKGVLFETKDGGKECLFLLLGVYCMAVNDSCHPRLAIGSLAVEMLEFLDEPEPVN